MKKYLFLLFMLVVYILLLIRNNTKNVANYNNLSNNNSTINIDIYFENGINSKKLVDEFKNYNYEYLIKNINIGNNSINLNCKLIEKCINNIYDMNDDDFYNKYIANGFRIEKLTIITDKNHIINYLKNKYYLYRIY